MRFDKLSEHNSVLPSQPSRLRHYHEIAVIAASIAVIVTSTGDQYQAMRSSLLEGLAICRERLLGHLSHRGDPVLQRMWAGPQRDRVADLDPEQPSEEADSLRSRVDMTRDHG
jgi:hypothetical protein